MQEQKIQSTIEDKRCFISQEDPKINQEGQIAIQRKMSYECKRTIKAHKDWVTKIVLLKNGSILSCSEDNTMKLWSIEDKERKPIQIFKGHTEGVVCAIQYSSGKIVSSSRDKTLRIWNIVSGKEVNCITSRQPYYCIAQLNDSLIAVAGGDRDIRIYDLSNDEETVEVGIMEGHELVIRDLAVLDKVTIASCSEDKTIKVWNYETKEMLFTLIGHTEGVKTIKLLSNGKLVSGGFDNLIKVWDLKKKECEFTLEGHTGHVFCLEELNDGRLISGATDWSMIVWDVEKRKKDFEIEGHNESVNSLIVLSDGRIVSCSTDQTIKIWE